MKEAKSAAEADLGGGSIIAQAGYSSEQFLSLLLLEQSTVRNFETASKNILLAESDMSLGYPSMPICAWIFKWWLCGFSPKAMLYKAPTIKIFVVYSFCDTAMKKSIFLESFFPYEESMRRADAVGTTLPDLCDIKIKNTMAPINTMPFHIPLYESVPCNIQL